MWKQLSTKNWALALDNISLIKENPIEMLLILAIITINGSAVR